MSDMARRIATNWLHVAAYGAGKTMSLTFGQGHLKVDLLFQLTGSAGLAELQKVAASVERAQKKVQNIIENNLTGMGSWPEAESQLEGMMRAHTRTSPVAFSGNKTGLAVSARVQLEGDPLGLADASFKKEWQDKATRMLGGVDGYKLSDVKHVNW